MPATLCFELYSLTFTYVCSNMLCVCWQLSKLNIFYHILFILRKLCKFAFYNKLLINYKSI